jgi:hypothetical protein
VTDYDYDRLERAAAADVKALEGCFLREVLVHIVEPEFNVVFLVTDDGVWEVSGRVGSEVLGISRAPEHVERYSTEHASVNGYGPYEQFQGRRIVQARTIGEAWNGHGFEFTFEGLPHRSMLIQSIYSSPKPPDLEDCLRLGIGVYASSTKEAG